MKRRELWVLAVVVAVAAGVAGLGANQGSPADALMGHGLHQEEVEGNLDAAIATYTKVVADPRADRALVAKALLHIGRAYEKLGKREARQAYERLTREFTDQVSIAAEARTRLAALAGSSAPDISVVARQVWVGFGAANGRPSNDGRLFAYVDWFSTPASNVAIRDLVTGETRLVTNSTSEHEHAAHPAVSPDGRHVAYAWSEPGGSSIRVSPLDGSRSRILKLEPGLSPAYLRWSPDGRRLATVLTDYATDRTSKIALVSVGDGSITALKPMGWEWPDLGDFSPDGRMLVYAMGESPSFSRRGLFAIEIDGGREVQLARSPAKDSSPVWTPDGRAVVFLSNRSGTDDLWAVRVRDGQAHGQPELLRANVGPVENLAFTRDGSLFYGTPNQQVDVYTCEIDPDTLQVKGTPKPVSDRFVGSNSGGRWSSDGHHVAFFRGSDRRRMSLVLHSLADRKERAIPASLHDTTHGGMVGPLWLAGDRAVLVSDADYANNTFSVVQVDVADGSTRTIVEGDDLWSHVRVSPDGKALYHTRREKTSDPEKNVLRMMRRNLETGEEAELYRVESDGIGFFTVAVSPDGTHLAFSANEGKGRTLMIVPTAGGPRRVIYTGTYTRPTPKGAAWTRDSRYILAVVHEGRDRSAIWAFPVDGGEPRKLDVVMQGMSVPDISPDGRHLLFTGVQFKPELWTIKNLLQQLAPSPESVSR
jgi:Tol biopolymer transport system component